MNTRANTGAAAAEDKGLALLMDLDVDALRRRVQRATGMRNSPRLEAITEILFLFGMWGGLCRADVIEELGDRYNKKLLDRAISDMESAGMLELVTQNRKQHAGGAEYRIAAPRAWGTRCPERMSQRRARFRRGHNARQQSGANLS